MSKDKVGIFNFSNEDTKPYTRTQQWNGLLDFDDDLLFGYFFKDIITLLLDKCGYEVYPYGYESFFPNLKRQLYGSKNTEVANRIRSTPDLLVRRAAEKQVYLVEVKARSASGKYGITINEVEEYRQFWPESIIILIIPSGNYFYAQYVNKLQIKPSYMRNDFSPIEDIFPLVKELPEDFRRKLVRKVRTLCHNRDCANL